MLLWLFFKFCPVGGVGHEVSFCPSSFKNFSVKKKKIDLYLSLVIIPSIS